MKVHLVFVPEGVVVQARAEGDAGLIGDLSHLVTPGESFAQFTHDELVAMGEGEHDLDLEDVDAED